MRHEEAHQIQVLRTYCPFWERTVYELWDGFRPIIPANNYLRSNLMLADTTLADKAFSLILFFRFLERNSLNFFDLAEETLKPFILHFRNELLFRARSADSAPAKPSETSGLSRGFGYVRARDVLLEVGALCEWWGLVRSRASQGIGFRGSRWSRVRNSFPEYFNIGIPRARKRFRENHVLEPTEVEAIWNHVTSEGKPARPSMLVKYPQGPQRGWTMLRSAAWKRAQQKYRERLAWFHRQQMLWALLIGSGMRRSEIPLVMVDDVQFHGEDLWVSLRLRKSTEHLGRGKSGPRTIFVGWDARVISGWQNWVRSRQILVSRWSAKSGGPDHRMFLTNRNGSPLTVEGMMSLFDGLNARFKLFGGEFLEDQFTLHPHAVRHTVEALFEEWGVPHEVRQRHLGHKKPETTDLYGKVYRKTYVAILSRLEPSKKQ